MPASSATIESVVACFDQATEANLSTPGRRGAVVDLSGTDAEELMATADLHGQRLNFRKLLKIAALNEHPRRHLLMQEVCHGGPRYPQGGCMSHLMLEDAARLKTQYPQRFHFLLSNHEMSEMMDFPITKGRKLLNLQFRTGLERFYGTAAAEVVQAYCRFLASCPLGLRLPNGVFLCHGSPQKAAEGEFDAGVFEREMTTLDTEPHGAALDVVWGRDFRPENGRALAEQTQSHVLIHGHEPCPTGFAAPNEWQIILDCCHRRACYLVVPVLQKISHESLVQSIRRLYGSSPR